VKLLYKGFTQKTLVVAVDKRPEVASPDMTSPEVASPEVASPEMTSPEVVNRK
jgi:hypothetical protein